MQTGPGKVIGGELNIVLEKPYRESLWQPKCVGFP
jgi:hypothetical protein